MHNFLLALCRVVFVYEGAFHLYITLFARIVIHSPLFLLMFCS